MRPCALVDLFFSPLHAPLASAGVAEGKTRMSIGVFSPRFSARCVGVHGVALMARRCIDGDDGPIVFPWVERGAHHTYRRIIVRTQTPWVGDVMVVLQGGGDRAVIDR